MLRIIENTLRLCLVVALFTASASASQARTSEFEAAWKLYQSGKPCEPAFEAVLANESNSEKDRFNSAYVLGVISLARNEGEAALTRFDTADGILAGRPQVSVRRSEALIHLGRLDQAEKVLTKLKKGGGLEQASSSVRARFSIASTRLLSARGEREKALGMLAELSKARPGDWEVHFVMATIYEALDLPEEAIYYYGISIENDPERDPHPGIYAYQRWAALTISTDPNAYNDRPKKDKAIHHYKVFLKRAKASGVDPKLVEQAKTAADALERFGA